MNLAMASTTSEKFPETKDGSSSYIFATGEQASANLDMQHQFLGKNSQDHVKKAGLSPGQTVLDIGCGGGVMIEYLAAEVGETGRVYALDISLNQLEVARNRVQNLGFKNVIFIEGSITELDNIPDLPVGEVDIVYDRFVFMHLTNPQQAIGNACRLLKSGGTLALQEPVMSTSELSVKNTVSEIHGNAIMKLAKRKGVDFDIGLKLEELCAKSGFEKVTSYTTQNKLSVKQFKPLFYSRSFEVEKELLEEVLITQEQINDWRMMLLNFSESDSDIYVMAAKQVYILAQKK